MKKPHKSDNSSTAEPEKDTWHRDQIFDRVMEVRRQRHEQYQPKADSSLENNMDAVGLAWTGLLTAFYGRPLPIIPGWLVCLMQAAQKGIRIVWNPEVTDSYEDGINYTALAEELYVILRRRTDERRDDTE